MPNLKTICRSFADLLANVKMEAECKHRPSPIVLYGKRYYENDLEASREAVEKTLADLERVFLLHAETLNGLIDGEDPETDGLAEMLCPIRDDIKKLFAEE